MRSLHLLAVRALFLASLPLLPGCFLHVVAFDDDPVYAEVEPNDTALSAPFYGGLRPGDGLAIEGHVQEQGFDLYDGAAVRADAPIELVFDLESHALFSDLDVCVYDPELGQFVVCADGPSDPEHGSVIVLEAGKVLHLVVTSAAGDAPYTLRIRARTAVFPLAAAAAARADAAGDPAKAAKRAGYARTDAPERPIERVLGARVYDLDTGRAIEVRAVRRGNELVLLPGPAPMRR
ncbi:MAG: hypothetical protein HZA53_11925 [Planctomycetes bacterium]|nr:hypothetical protein [Planctomycetota bacterium]